MKVVSYRIVHVEFSGDPRPGHGFPDDHGLVGRFLRWQIEQEVFPAVMANTQVGGGCYHASFYEKDAARVFAWFRENGVEVLEPCAGAVSEHV